MKYSQQQLNNISDTYDTINMSIYLTNLRSQSIQSVIIDNQIPEDLLDSRNSNDIQNDLIARKNEYYKYSSKLFNKNDAEIRKLQALLNENGLSMFFLENYPRIMQESKGYRMNTSDNIFKLTMRLYNKQQEELNYGNKNKYLKANWQSVLSLLYAIINTLQSLKFSNISPDGEQIINDRIQRIDALTTVLQNVQNPEEFIFGLTGMTSLDLTKYITKINEIEWYNEQLNSEIWKSYVQQFDPFFSYVTNEQMINALDYEEGIEIDAEQAPPPPFQPIPVLNIQPVNNTVQNPVIMKNLPPLVPIPIPSNPVSNNVNINPIPQIDNLDISNESKTQEPPNLKDDWEVFKSNLQRIKAAISTNMNNPTLTDAEYELFNNAIKQIYMLIMQTDIHGADLLIHLLNRFPAELNQELLKIEQDSNFDTNLTESEKLIILINSLNDKFLGGISKVTIDKAVLTKNNPPPPISISEKVLTPEEVQNLTTEWTTLKTILEKIRKNISALIADESGENNGTVSDSDFDLYNESKKKIFQLISQIDRLGVKLFLILFNQTPNEITQQINQLQLYLYNKGETLFDIGPDIQKLTDVILKNVNKPNIDDAISKLNPPKKTTASTTKLGKPPPVKKPMSMMEQLKLKQAAKLKAGPINIVIPTKTNNNNIGIDISSIESKIADGSNTQIDDMLKGIYDIIQEIPIISQKITDGDTSYQDEYDTMIRIKNVGEKIVNTVDNERKNNISDIDIYKKKLGTNLMNLNVNLKSLTNLKSLKSNSNASQPIIQPQKPHYAFVDTLLTTAELNDFQYDMKQKKAKSFKLTRWELVVEEQINLSSNYNYLREKIKNDETLSDEEDSYFRTLIELRKIAQASYKKGNLLLDDEQKYENFKTILNSIQGVNFPQTGAGFDDTNDEKYEMVYSMKFPDLKALVSKLKLPNPKTCKKKDLQKTLIKYYNSQ